MLLQLFLFACIGVAFEVVFTAVTDFPKNRSWRLLGYSYIWMLPIYALIPVFLGILYPWMGAWPLLARVSAYAGLLMVVEYVTGWILRRTTGACPWESNYYGSRWAIHGLVRLDYFPSWAFACFLFEKLYLALRAL